MDDTVIRGAIFRSRVFGSPARVAAASMPMLGVEPEIAFHFDRDMPPREAAYAREEIVAGVTAFVAIEIVDSRFTSYADAPLLDRAADCVSNGGFVRGTRNDGWRDVDLANLVVSLTIDGEVVVRKTGGHPTTDPLLPAIDLVNQLRRDAGVKAGQFMTTGSYAGLHVAKPSQTVTAAFDDFGSAEVSFLR
jgi:2-keto-4-pentenoate hydratase